MIQQLEYGQRLTHDTATRKDRGERLYPSRVSRLYWVLTQLRQELEAIIATYVANRDLGTLVDYGCGDMPYRPLFQQHVRRYIGCDLAGNAWADCSLESGNQLPFASSSVSIVLSSQVLEHVDEPRQYLAEACRVLQRQGLLILSTHGVWKYHPDPQDYWRWTSSGLKREIEACGFEVRALSGILGPSSTGLQLFQDAVIPAVPNLLKPVLCYIMQRCIRLADRLSSPDVKSRDASVFLIVAEKC
jgi:SAM-dependent methyltransferase